jgi:hypothetical protein
MMELETEEILFSHALRRPAEKKVIQFVWFI